MGKLPTMTTLPSMQAVSLQHERARKLRAST
jgi:hypothetical protein